MKGKLLLLWLVLVTSCVFGQTWVRHLEWEDLVPAWEHNPGANAYNVIPAVDGGYIMHGVVTIHNYVDEYTNVFWKVTESGEVVWRNDQPTFDNTPMTCLVSNGINKYYGLSSEYHRNILYTYDAQLNPINSIMIDSLLTNGEHIQFWSMIAVDDGLVFGGRNFLEPFILKINYGYEIEWSRTFHELESSILNDIKKTLDGGLIWSGDDNLVHMNSQGDTLWVYRTETPVTSIGSIIPKTDGSYIVQSSLEPYQQGISQFDSNGNHIVSHPYILPGDLVGTGRYFTASADQQVVILRATFDTNPVWEDHGMMHKLSPEGEFIWHNVYQNNHNSSDVGHGRSPMIIDDQGYYTLCIDPMTIIRADENGNAVSNEDPSYDTPGIVSVQVYPNPAKERINFAFSILPRSGKISMSIYNLRGQLVDQIAIGEDARQQQWDQPLGFGNGVYIFKLLDCGDLLYSGKFTIIR